jgi:tetratricopeptide (TPR) repeat protein
MSRRTFGPRADSRDNMASKPERIRSHPLYGDIPMLPVPHKAPSGRDDSYWRYDLDWRPSMPAGAVRGEPKRQLFCPMCHVPKYFYVDEEKTCASCGERFVFGAREQKFWYEDLHFNFHSTAIRCLACRKRKRDLDALRRQVGEAVRQAREKPDDPMALLALVEATVAQAEAGGGGDLDRAVAAARKAARRAPACYEAVYWEARAQERAGRADKAAEAYARFIELGSTRARCKNLVRDAEKRLKRVK